MKQNIITDAAQAVRITKEIRTARKQGQSVGTTRRVPLIRTGYWDWTMESGLFYDKPQEVKQAIRTVFRELPEEVQHSLCFTPNTEAEFVARAQFWKEALRSVDTKNRSQCMIIILKWYRNCLERWRTPEMQYHLAHVEHLRQQGCRV